MRILEWDSNFFGICIAMLESTSTDEFALAEAHQVQCAYVRVATNDFHGIRTVESRGGHLVDTRVEFECELDALGEISSPSGVLICEQRPGDEDALLSIAASAHSDSRFYADNHFSPSRVSELYQTWLRESLSGKLADRVFVADLEGRPAGYATIGADGQIGLIAVANSAHRRGAGTALVRHVQMAARARQLRKISVVTQASNIPAMRLYERCGYLVAKTSYSFHIWFSEGVERTTQEPHL